MKTHAIQRRAVFAIAVCLLFAFDKFATAQIGFFDFIVLEGDHDPNGLPLILFDASATTTHRIVGEPGQLRFHAGNGADPQFRITTAAPDESLVLNSSGLHVLGTNFRVQDSNGGSRFRVTTGAAIDSLIVNSQGVTSKGLTVDGILKVESNAPQISLDQADANRVDTILAHDNGLGFIVDNELKLNIDEDAPLNSLQLNPDGIRVNDANFRVVNSNGGSRFRVTTGAPVDSLIVNSLGVTSKGLNVDGILTLGNGLGVPFMRFEHADGFGDEIVSFDSGMGFDVDNDYKLWIGADAPEFAISMRQAGVGIGTFSPNEALHVYSNGERFVNAKVVVENDLDTTEFREMFSLINNGGSRFTMQNTDNNTKWAFAADPGGRFTFSVDNSGGPELAIFPNGRVIMGPGPAQNFDLDSKGNLRIAGTLSQSSDRDLKTAFRDVDTSDVLKRVEKMPISTWQFKFDDPELRHMGPTAQDFYSAFQLGKDEKTIAPVDGIGVSLAAIKALSEKVEHKEQRIQCLTAEVSKQRKLLNEQEQTLEAQEDLLRELIQRLEVLESAD